MNFKKLNGINFVTENIKDTPRTAIYIYLAAKEEIPFDGANVLVGNLLLQGTDKKTSEEIATELENLGIEVSVDSGIDSCKISIVCLDEDVEKAVDIVSDLMKNSTFASFDKEVFKLKGEITATIDSPSRKASDAFYRELFKGHKYGVTNTKILEQLDELKIEHVKQHYQNLLNGKKIISVAASITDEDALLDMLSKKFDFLKTEEDFEIVTDNLQHKEGALIKITKNDAKQAQIFQGWITDSMESSDCAKLTVLSNILGASGLSSRLFTELRDKQGLAYTVRSSYKSYKHAAAFVLYIGTEPSNIKKSLDGFKTEIQKIITNPPDEVELRGAIENYTGKFKYFYTQTNAQIANANGWNWIAGLGFDYNKKLLEEVGKVTIEDVVETAKKYLFKEPVTVVLAPDKYLDF